MVSYQGFAAAAVVAAFVFGVAIGHTWARSTTHEGGSDHRSAGGRSVQATIERATAPQPRVRTHAPMPVTRPAPAHRDDGGGPVVTRRPPINAPAPGGVAGVSGAPVTDGCAQTPGSVRGRPSPRDRSGFPRDASWSTPAWSPGPGGVSHTPSPDHSSRTAASVTASPTPTPTPPPPPQRSRTRPAPAQSPVSVGRHAWRETGRTGPQ